MIEFTTDWAVLGEAPEAMDASVQEFYRLKGLEDHPARTAELPQPSGDQVSLHHIFTDPEGLEQHTYSHTTVCAEKMRSKAHEIQAALQVYYRAIGCELISLQLSVERNHHVAGTRAEATLKLVRQG